MLVNQHARAPKFAAPLLVWTNTYTQNTISNFQNTLCARNVIQRLLFASLFPNDKNPRRNPPRRSSFYLRNTSLWHFCVSFWAVITEKHSLAHTGERVVVHEQWLRARAFAVLTFGSVIMLYLRLHHFSWYASASIVIAGMKNGESREFRRPPPSNCSHPLRW